MSSLYDKIGTYLSSLDVCEIQLSFEKLEKVTGGLAPSAKYDRTWWANTRHSSRTQAQGWLDAGWKVDKVDFGFGVKFLKLGLEDKMIDNRQLITSKIEELATGIKKIDDKIINESKPLQIGNVFPQNLIKINSLSAEREKLIHTQTAFFAILGQWKSN